MTRDISDTTVLTEIGYFGLGAKGYIDIDEQTNLTRAVSGTGVVKMPSRVAFA